MQRMQTPRGVEFVMPRTSNGALNTGGLFFLLFGAFFGGIPLVMLVFVLFGIGDDMPILARLGFSAFISIFVLVGAGVFSAGVLMLRGTVVVRVEGDTIRAGRKFGPLRWMPKYQVTPETVLEVQSASSQMEALRGLRQVAARGSLGATKPIVRGLAESDAKELVAALAEELGLRAETATPSQDPARVEEALEQQDESLTQRQHDVELPPAAVQVHWQVLLPIAIILDTIVVGVLVAIFVVKGSLPIVGMVVGGVFFVIASVMVAVAIHQAMADRKLGAPVVTLSVHPILLGEPFTLRVSQPVKAGGKHDGVTVTVFMRETAKYRRGTNTYTVTHDTFKQAVELVPAGPLTAGRNLEGQVEFEVPTGAMHTLKGNNNNVNWMVKVHTVLPGWPDYRRSFELTVFPRAFVDTANG